MKFKDYEYSEYEYSKPKKVSKTHQIEITSKMIDELVNSRIDNKIVLGYVKQNGKGELVNCKYNKQNQLFVEFKDGKIISKRLKLWREYTGDKGFEYYDEIAE